MTQGGLEGIPKAVERQFADLEKRVMEDVVGRIKANGFSPAASDWQIDRLRQLGESEENIRKMIKEALEASDQEMERIFSDEVYSEYYGHDRAYRMSGASQISFEQNRELQSLLESISYQTAGEFKNITASMGFAIRNTATGKLTFTPLADFYQNTLDAAILDIATGAFAYNTALSRTVKAMTDGGLRTVGYASGRSDRVDVAARRAIMTGFRQVQGKINEQVARDLKTDHYEVTYHVGARPSHQPWQGRVWSMKQLVDVCGLGSVVGLKGANCYHDYNAFIPGVSVRTYTDTQLEGMLAEENTPKEYHGKGYTTYEALQAQRKMEVRMRQTRMDINLLQKGEGDPEDILLRKARYQGQLQAYKDFSKKMDMPEQMKRVYQDGLRVTAGGAKKLAKQQEGVILKETTDKWPQAAKKKLLLDEKALSPRKTETAVVYHPDGEYFFQKRGSETEVRFTHREMRRMKGCVISHNHPSGSSLSVEDVVSLWKSKATEIRATTESGVYFMQKPKKWPKDINGKAKIRGQLNSIRIEVAKECQELYKAGQISKTERFYKAVDETNRRFAERYGIRYGKEAFGD